MSDFLISFTPGLPAASLQDLLQLAFSRLNPPGECFDFPWGSACLLRDPISPHRRAIYSPGRLFGAVGDFLPFDLSPLADELIVAAAEVRQGHLTHPGALESHPGFQQLNGAFAILLGDAAGPSIITDPLGSVQVYAGWDSRGNLMALGTHPDLVACLADNAGEFDPVSVFEFLNAGTPCFPHTMYRGVSELAPGRLHTAVFDQQGHFTLRDAVWWPFPAEFEKVPDEQELAATLGNAFRAAVQERCPGGTVAVTLSGGLDSRLVMAAVPGSTPCIGFTFCDAINREARVARRVARCYGRDWVPLFRDSEYIARTAMDTIKFIGCEGDWVNAHGMGLVRDIAKYNVTAVFTGLLMNNNVKGYYAADVQRVPRWGGLLPPLYRIGPYDYASEMKPYSSGVFREGLLEEARGRRQTFFQNHPGRKRESVAEWLDGYPFSQAPDNTAWVAERRLMPMRIPAMDRRLLDVSCSIPMRMKAGGRFFGCMAESIFGKGARIPDANDGVRPGSSHVSRLVQRVARKAENNGRGMIKRLGWKAPPPHSWHDYQGYWRESILLRSLAVEHGKNLRDFADSVFTADPAALLDNPDLPWLNAFRLTQLALWRSAIHDYRAALEKSKAGTRLFGAANATGK